jgi:type II secretory pathway pseudopilin PulG
MGCQIERIRGAIDAHCRPRLERARSEAGDTLIEVLIAMMVIGITATAILGAFSTSISASAEHQNLASLDTVLKSFVESATYQIEQAPAGSYLFTTSCSSPNPYSSLTSPPGKFTASITQVQYSIGVHPTLWGACNASVLPPQSQLITATATGGGGSESTYFVVSDPAYQPAPLTPPTITSMASASGQENVPFNFMVTTSGFPSGPTLTIKDGGATLPSGVSFVDDGDGTATISGTPATGTAGTYNFTITANNGVGQATQLFTLAIGGAPAITSAQTAPFTAGVAGPAFTIQTSGTPAVNSITNASFTGCTPTPLAGTGVSFTYASGSSATVTTSTTTPVNNYTLCINASNGLGIATQTLTVSVTTGTPKLVITSQSISGTATSSATLGPVTIQQQDATGNPLPASGLGLVVTLSSNSAGTAAFSATSGGPSVTSITIPGGQSSVSFYYGDTKAGTPTISGFATGITPGTQQETINAGSMILVLANCKVNSSAQPCAGITTFAVGNHGSFSAAIQAVDQFGNPIPITSTVNLPITWTDHSDFSVSPTSLVIDGSATPPNQTTSTFTVQYNSQGTASTTVTIKGPGSTSLVVTVTK